MGLSPTTVIHQLPVVIGGAGPGGMTTGLALHSMGDLVHVFDERGFTPTRPRSTYMRHEAREVLTALGLPDPGLETTIAQVESLIRVRGMDVGVPVSFRQRIEDVVEHDDHVAVTVRDLETSAIQELRASIFVNATAGKLKISGGEAFERRAIGPHHGYVGASYDEPPPHPDISVLFDPRTRDVLYAHPTADQTGFVAHLDLRPSDDPADAQAMVARYVELSEQVRFGRPVLGPTFFDGQQHLSKLAARGRIVDIGDTVGNADPYTSSGVSAAIADASLAARAIHLLNQLPVDSPEAKKLTRQLSRKLIARHRSMTTEGMLLLKARSLGGLVLPHGSLDARLGAEQLQGQPLLTRLIKQYLDR